MDNSAFVQHHPVDFDKYESPVEVTVKMITEDINENINNQITAKVNYELDIDIDTEELQKVLRYDRDQYEKGYHDGYERAQKEDRVIHAHWVDNKGRYVKNEYRKALDEYIPRTSCWCSNCGKWLIASDEYSVEGAYCPHCGATMDGSSNDE